MPLELRERLHSLSETYHATFIDLVSRLGPLLSSIAVQFPEYTRHDPSHNLRLEVIAAEILTPRAKEALTGADLFVLLCSLWLHDAGMGIHSSIEADERGKLAYTEKSARFQRLGLLDADCWREYVRENHHHFCIPISEEYLHASASPFLINWIGQVGESHGDCRIHDRSVWPKRVAVGESETIHPPILATTVRLADILHFSFDRAPDFMLEHRHIVNMLSMSHWRAHQIAAGYTIDDDICYFDGATNDDEAYWFAQQFFDAMDKELRYCKADVIPTLGHEFAGALTFSRVERRITPQCFLGAEVPVTLRVEAPKLLEDLLNDALYAGKPAWFRELLQNAFDACRDRAAQDPSADPRVTIDVTTKPETIEFSDTGIGMRRATVEHFLLVAGASFWSSQEYRGEPTPHAGHVGRFGIGFMSVFAVAEAVTIETRHAGETRGWRFTIRSARQVVRVEPFERVPPGTTILLHLKDGTLADREPVELLLDVCSYPEFPLSLNVDGTVEKAYPVAVVPSTIDEGFVLRATEGVTARARIVSREIRENGIVGAFQMAKIHSAALNAYVPDLRGWLKGAGWLASGTSKTIYGGVTYPALHAVPSPAGFNYLPSIGVLRVAVSPNVFPLEMNLARDAFAAGEGTHSLLSVLCGIMDRFISEDLVEELSAHSGPAERSAIAGLHSWTLLNLWAGHVSSLSALASTAPSAACRPIEITPWPSLTRVMENSLVFTTLDRLQRVQRETLGDLLDSDTLLFGAGMMGSRISNALQEAVFAFSPSAKLLIGLPDHTFGILVLQHWAREEFLVPVPSHARCAFGLRLARNSRPFPFFPRETERLGLPVASGPPEFALLDYRDLMAEASYQPTGGPAIVGVLNRRNDKVEHLLEALTAFPDHHSLRRRLGSTFRELRSALVIGDANRYSGGASGLIGLLNSVAESLRIDRLPIQEDDIPHYMGGGTVTPFGRPHLDQLSVGVLGEIQGYDAASMKLA